MRTSGTVRAIGLAMVLYAVLAAASVASLLPRTGGRFIYPTDDTYISMAIAKNLAEYGVMGLTRHEFSSSTSCPLWILLLAGVYRLTGVNWWAPVLLSFSFGMAVLPAAGRILRRYAAGPALTGGVLAVFCVVTPLPALGLSGMEHTLHILLFLCFAAPACRYLAEGSGSARACVGGLAALMAVMVMVRYESLFAAAIFSVLALLRRRWLAAIAIPASGAASALLFGLYSVSHGWEWLPNTLLLKGNTPDFSSVAGITMFLGRRSLINLYLSPHLLGLAALLAAVFAAKSRRGARFWEAGQLMLAFAFLALMVHLQFASVGWFFRYEAYLIAFGVLALAANRADVLIREAIGRPAWSRRTPAAAAVALALLFALGPLAIRGAAALQGFRAAAYNIFEQQYQMAHFLRQYYGDVSIAANDVGAINFFNDLRCLDLVGLCNRDVYRLTRRKAYDSAAVESLAASAGVRIAMVYRDWFNGISNPAIPKSWTLVGEWTIADNRFLGGPTVSMYAVQSGEAAYLAQSLRQFSPALPATVRAVVYSTEGESGAYRQGSQLTVPLSSNRLP